MVMNNKMVNEEFLIEKIVASKEEIDVLKTIGITIGKKIMILGQGYLEGSIIVLVDDKLLQLNPHFVSEIEGSIVVEKVRSK